MEKHFLYKYRSLCGSYGVKNTELLFKNNEIYFASRTQLNDTSDLCARPDLFNATDEEFRVWFTDLRRKKFPNETVQQRAIEVESMVKAIKLPNMQQSLVGGIQQHLDKLGVL